MALPAGFSSDEELDGFMTDESDHLEEVRNAGEAIHAPRELNPDEILNKLFFAIMNENLEEVQTILNEGLDVNVKLKDNWTPLMLAASVGNSDITRELISRNADVNADRDKYTVLMAACSCPSTTISNCLEVVTQLLEKGAVVDAVTSRRKTALMFAASTGSLEIIMKLLEVSSNIHAEDNQGWNALFWAVTNNKPEAVQLLVNNGLNASKADIRGSKPVDYALAEGYEEIVNILTDQDDCNLTGLPENSYDLEDFLVTNKRPKFSKDINCILYGMKCEYLLKKFIDVDLFNFLTINEEELIKLDVSLPYERNRILQGLYNFHKYTYKQNSLTIVAKNSVCSTIDVSHTIISIIRQLIIMEASMKYIRSNIKTENLINLHIQMNYLETKIYKLKKAATKLKSICRRWDTNVETVDFIGKQNDGWKCGNWWKLLFCASATLISFTIICKKSKTF